MDLAYTKLRLSAIGKIISKTEYKGTEKSKTIGIVKLYYQKGIVGSTVVTIPPQNNT